MMVNCDNYNIQATSTKTYAATLSELKFKLYSTELFLMIIICYNNNDDNNACLSLNSNYNISL